MIYASLRSFKSWVLLMRVLCSFESGSLGIPSLWHSFIVLTWDILTGNGSLSTLSFATSCSWLWILCASLRLQNLTPGTKRCSMIYASLRSFKSWALLIPGLIRYTIVTTWSIWLETARLKWYITLGNKKDAFRRLLYFLNQQLPILPGRFQPSTFGVYELNYCVRDGNRWFLVAIVTEFVRVFPENYIEE